VCQEWEDFTVFESWASTSGYKHGLTLDRIDNDVGYEPGNVRWATYSEQNFNQRVSRRNKTGTTGVHYDKARDKWVAEYKSGDTRLRKRFDTLEEASKARQLWINSKESD
jgi:hypothetical protein